MSAFSASTVSGRVPGTVLLKQRLRRQQRQKRIGAFALTMPLLGYLTVLFIVPLIGMVWISVANNVVPTYMPRTVKALTHWQPGGALPSEKAYAAVAADLRVAFKHHTFGRIGKRLNEESPGALGLVSRTAFRTAHMKPHQNWKKVLVKLDPKWGQMPIWRLLKRQSSPVTPDYYLAALDLRYGPQGHIERVPPYERIHIKLFIRTAWMSSLVTLLTVLLGYPLAYWISQMPERKANIVIIAVLLPFWTSLLVRITAWIVLLQSHGVVDSLLVSTGIVPSGNRPHLIFNALGTIIVMTQVLLPFMVLPLYSVMRGIPGSYVRAAVSLGAHPWYAFWKVFAPLTKSGVAAGVLLVFILSIGYYITPELVGGQTGQFITNRIAYNVQKSLNWGLAAALGTVLTVVTLALFGIFHYFLGEDRISLG